MTIHPVELADTNIDFNTDIEPQQESYSAEEIKNDIRDMDAQVNSPLRQIEFNTDDLNVGQLVEFYEPVIEAFNHRDASVPVTPPRSGGAREPTSSTIRSTAPAIIPPLRRNLLNYYQPGDTIVLVKEYAMNITVKEALRSRGEEAERVILKELAQMRDTKV